MQKGFTTAFEQTAKESPFKFTFADWWAVIKRTWLCAKHDNVTVIAAGVAFFSLLAVFPMISAALQTFSYFANPGAVNEITATLASLMPNEAYGIIESQIKDVIDTGDRTFSAGIIVSLGIAVFSAGAGIRAMMRAMNVAYEEVETRNFLMFYFHAALMTVGSFIFIWVSLSVIIGVPAALSYISLEGLADDAARILPWILLIAVFCFGCGVMYRFGPSRRPARKRWIYPGIAFAMISWVVISYGFSKFVTNFGNYNEVFGGLASVVILLVWLWLTANVVILGAQLNSELERQTIADSTRGPARPLGNRGAAMADFLARDTKLKQAKSELEHPIETEPLIPLPKVLPPSISEDPS